MNHKEGPESEAENRSHVAELLGATAGFSVATMALFAYHFLLLDFGHTKKAGGLLLVFTAIPTMTQLGVNLAKKIQKRRWQSANP